MITNEKQYLETVKQLHKFNLAIVAIEHGRETGLDYELQEFELKGLKNVAAELSSKLDEYDEKYHCNRVGGWFYTINGHRFWPYDPRPEDIHIEDIAEALSKICRFCGHTKELYSVGQHSVNVSYVVHPSAALAGLLHDAAEAYLGDIIRPIKKDLRVGERSFSEFEDAVMVAVCQKFRLDFLDAELWKEVKRGDDVILTTEMRDLGRCGARRSMPNQPPANFHIRDIWEWQYTKEEFLARFNELINGE